MKYNKTCRGHLAVKRAGHARKNFARASPAKGPPYKINCSPQHRRIIQEPWGV